MTTRRRICARAQADRGGGLELALRHRENAAAHDLGDEGGRVGRERGEQRDEFRHQHEAAAIVEAAAAPARPMRWRASRASARRSAARRCARQFGRTGTCPQATETSEPSQQAAVGAARSARTSPESGCIQVGCTPPGGEKGTHHEPDGTVAGCPTAPPCSATSAAWSAPSGPWASSRPIAIAGVLLAVVTDGAVQDALLKFILFVIKSFARWPRSSERRRAGRSHEPVACRDSRGMVTAELAVATLAAPP